MPTIHGRDLIKKIIESRLRFPFLFIVYVNEYFCFVFHQDDMTFIMANRVEEVLRAAFDDEFPGMAQATSSKL